MKDHLNRTARRSGWLAAALCACVVLTLSLRSVSQARAVDLNQNCSLTVSTGAIEDAANADVVVDLYKVADAAAVPGEESIAFETTAPYGALDAALGDLQHITSADYEELAQQAAAITLTQGQQVAKAADGVSAGTAIQGLDSGLYLIVARGAVVENYVSSLTDESGAERIVTLAHSGAYTYTFLPELISLPTKDADESGTVSTANPGEWVYDAVAMLKPEQSARFGSLEIVKTLRSFAAGQDASFVFEVNAWQDNTKETLVYSNVVTIAFDASGEKTALVESAIPVGAYVEVTEVYFGATYTLTGDVTQSAVISAEETASVRFVNDYDEGGKQGGTVNNHFDYQSDSGWSWTQE